MENVICKSCGGRVSREGNYHVCKFCGFKWMIDADQDVHVIDRANAWSALRDCDFEKATELFETILLKEPKNHEAYWGRALARAGIIYVTDLDESKKVPTCNNITEDSFLESTDVQKAISLSPADLRETYRSQAEYIERVRLEWLKKASREPEYDVFLSFKDSDREHGIERTQDSIDAQDLYNALVAEGYRVFFSRISLRDKVAEHYEPYIYNAIKTAKVMIVFGERPEYFSSVWIKNEWSRFKARIEKGEKHKNALVVVCKNMNPGDLPAALRSRQCLNASDMTFLPDLYRHIARVVEATAGAAHLDRIQITGGQISKKASKIANESIQKREIGAGGVAETSINEKQSFELAKSYVNGNQWEEAAKLIEDILFNDPSYAEAIWYGLLVKYRVKTSADLLKGYTLDRMDLATVEKTLGCANREFATEILDLLYRSRPRNNDLAYLHVLQTVLPFDYPNRAERIRECFSVAVSNDQFEIFKLLLGTVDSADVDTYIDYHLKYATATKSLERKKYCLEAVLAVEEGNLDALRTRFKIAFDTEKYETVVDYFERLLKYSSHTADEVLNVLDLLSTCELTPDKCAFAKQALKYYPAELSDIKQKLIKLAYQMINCRFFAEAQYFLNLIIPFDPHNADVYWGLCLIKTKSTSQKDIVLSQTPLKGVPEYTKYLTLVSEARRQECFALVKKQEASIVGRKKQKKAGVIAALAIVGALALVAFVAYYLIFVQPKNLYNDALAFMEEGKYQEALDVLGGLNGYGDSEEKIEECKNAIREEEYQKALALMADGKYQEAIKALEVLEGYGDSASKINECKNALCEEDYQNALSLMALGKFEAAIKVFEGLGGYKESAQKLAECQAAIGSERYAAYLSLVENQKYRDAYLLLLSNESIPNRDAEMKKLQALINEEAKDLASQGNYDQAYACLSGLTPETAFPLIEAYRLMTAGDYISAVRAGLTALVLPNNVTSIGEYAFQNCTELVSVTVPANVTEIGHGAFEGCTSLESITLPFIGRTMGDYEYKHFGYIFGAYYDYENADYVPASLKTVVITEETEIPARAFASCAAITDVTLPDTVTSIGDEAFYGCAALSSFEIPGAVTLIGHQAFSGCVAMPTLEIPGTVTGIGEGAFAGWTQLTSITVPDSVTLIGHGAFENCTAVESITIPFVGKTKDGTEYAHLGYIFGAYYYYDNDDRVPATLTAVTVTGGSTVPAHAFDVCTGLTSVTVPDTVTAIGDYAFAGCTGLTAFEIPDAVTTVGEGAFQDCTGLTALALPNTVTSIGDEAFYGCVGLTSFEVPTSVTEIGHSAFSGCTSLESITLPFVGKTKDGTEYRHFGYIFGAYYHYDNDDRVPATLTAVTLTDGAALPAYAFDVCVGLTSITLPDTLTSIGVSAFSGCTGLTEMELPQGVTSIENSAFKDCASLTAITIPGTVTTIGESAFAGCTALTEVAFPNTLTAIGASAFKDCTGLTAVTVPDRVTEIGSAAFKGCTALESIALPFVGMTKNGTENVHFGYIFGASSYYYNDDYVPTSLKNVAITGGTSIPVHAFDACVGLASVTLPGTVSSIGDGAFSGCTGLRAMVIPTGVASIAASSFKGCTSLASVTIPQGVTSIGDSAFEKCTALLSVTIPSTVAGIGEKAFYDCQKLIEVYDLSDRITVEKGSTSNGYLGYYAMDVYSDSSVESGVWSDENGFLFYEREDVCYLMGYTGTETALTLPASCHEKDYAIYSGAFMSFTTPESITVPAAVTTIGKDAFSDCTSLVSVTFAQNSRLSSIGENAFSGCSALAKIEIPASVVSIGTAAFYECTGLSEVKFGENSLLESIANEAFRKCSALASITLPMHLASIGQYAFYDCSNLQSVLFDAVDGWWYSYSATATSGTDLSSTDLTNASTAAKYLKNTYASYYWRRTVTP